MKPIRNIDFLYEIGCYRYVPRMWTQFLGPDFANDSEHSFRVVWIALLLAEQEGKGNKEKIMKMALIHDLPESRMGDTHYISRMYNTREHEDRALEDIFDKTSVRKEFLALWQEYKKRKSIESKIVKDADTLDVDLELMEQGARGDSLKKLWLPQRKVVAKTIFTKSAKKMWQDIYKTDPRNWIIKATNRLNKGDWKKFKKE